uniref:Uncharacterized protein n=1 Tax=Tetradesmus obliquus TaxID=3088 RepID=A0A383WJQ2_TETOB|eukprot:jgi/Sobl393_1/11501/SZX62043.1
MLRPLTRASTAGRRAAALRAAPVVEAIDLLSDESEDESEDEEVIELLDSDDYEVIEILDSSEEEESDEDDVQIVCCITPAKQQPQQRRQSLRQQSLQKQRSQQKQQQKQQLGQQPPRSVIHMYVDGSYRPRATAKNPYSMAAGVYAANGRLSMSRILQGGKPDSCRAELGTIYAAIQHLATAGLAGLLPSKLARTAAGAQAGWQGQQQQQSAATGLVQQVAAEVHILTDCQSCLDMIVVRDRVKEKYGALVRAIKRLKSSLPFVVRILKVKGHSKARDAHAVGNDAAHWLAYRCSAHQPVCTLPV